jgi:hypothetical protein
MDDGYNEREWSKAIVRKEDLSPTLVIHIMFFLCVVGHIDKKWPLLGMRPTRRIITLSIQVAWMNI